MPGPDIAELVKRVPAFQQSLDKTKASLASEGIVWYPYYTMASLGAFEKVLTGPRRYLLDLAGGDPVLDLGCSDGLLSFFFESLGCDVLAVDNPHVNHNALRGFNALHAALGSKVQFESVDLDTQFHLPPEVFGLTLFLGVLYHLKNPYYVLDALAPHSRYCLLSTRIAQKTPRGNPMKDESLAYFLAPAETNNDNTNYWIFSETALRTLVDRTGWRICDFGTTGDTRHSEPARLDRDERAFCLLESKRCPRYSVQLVSGWYELEQNSFRWTEPRFSVEIRRPHLISFSNFRLNFRLESLAPVTLSARVNGKPAPPATFAQDGEYSYSIDLLPEVLKAPQIRIDFELDKAIQAVVMDRRELGLLVPFWSSETGLDPLLPFVLS